MGIFSWQKNDGCLKLIGNTPVEQSEKPAAVEITEKIDEPEKSEDGLESEKTPQVGSPLKVSAICAFYVLWALFFSHLSSKSATSGHRERESMWKSVEGEISANSSSIAAVLEEATKFLNKQQKGAVQSLLINAYIALVVIMTLVAFLWIVVRQWSTLKAQGSWAHTARAMFISSLFVSVGLLVLAVYYQVENILEIRSDRSLLSLMKL